MKITDIGEKNRDGSIKYRVEWTPEEIAEGKLGGVKTGGIAGIISLSDGTAIDVTPFAVAVKLEHVGPIQHHIHNMRHQLDPDYFPAHVCNTHGYDCGFEAVEGSAPFVPSE